jgi:geranylgeranyl reductase family protein
VANIDYDVIIVGAGPIGGYLARKMAERKISVLMLEEHSQIGRPFQCAGLVSPQAMDSVNLHNTVLSSIWGARLYSPSGISVEIGNPNQVRTWSVCRKLFDEAIVERALNSGCHISLESKPTKAINRGDFVELEYIVKGKLKTVKTKLICGADGAHSWVRRYFKMGRPRELMVGFQIEVTGYNGKEGVLDVFTGSEISPGFFAWVIPSGETSRIGMWSKGELLNGKSCEYYLNSLMNSEKWTEKFNNCNEVGRFVGPIPAGMLKNVTSDRVVLFGDAAGLCKPTTGGGIGPGFKQIELIIDQLCELIHKNETDAINLKLINEKFDSLRKEQRRARALRDAFLTNSSDEELDENFLIWSKPEVIELINEVGEIENPIPLGLKMIREIPDFRKVAGKAMKAIFWGN